MEEWTHETAKIEIAHLRKKVDELKETIAEQEERLRWLDALEEAGVDNWEGYDYAQEITK